jgi:tetratricopeptide (TPR) repeat protein
MLRRLWMGLAFLMVALAVPMQARAQPPREAETAMAASELEALLAPLGDASVDVRRAAAKQVSELGVGATQAFLPKLAELRKGSGPAVASVMKPLKGREGPDLVETLLQTKGDAAAVRATLTTVCLLRALAHIGTTPAVRQLVLAASDAGGAFRPELLRLMKQLGDRAVAALIEARKDAPADSRAWASSVLDVLGKRLPSDAVQTKSNQVISDVLHAYASVKDLDAVPVILSFVNTDRAQVRTAAREALLQYGQDALWKLREAYASVTGKQAPEAWTAAELAKELFDAYDKFRLQEVYALLDEGLARQREGKLSEAVSDFDKVLARQPLLDRRSDIVEGYLAYAREIEAKDRDGALTYLRKALRLDEAGPHANEAMSEIDYLEGEDLLGRGVADAELFRKAVQLDPNNTHARAELARLESDASDREARWRRLAAAGAVFALSVAGIILFGARRRVKKRR